MNNKGFAITGVMYSVLIIFVVMITTLLFNLQNRKTILDELKADTINAVESDNNYEYLLEEINKLKMQVGTTDISSIEDGTLSGAINSINSTINILNGVNGVLIKYVNLTFSNGQATTNITFDENYTIAYNSGYSIIASAQGNVHVYVESSGITNNGDNTYTITAKAVKNYDNTAYSGTTVCTFYIPYKVK